jgi:hypothetical protein
VPSPGLCKLDMADAARVNRQQQCYCNSINLCQLGARCSNKSSSEAPLRFSLLPILKRTIPYASSLREKLSLKGQRTINILQKPDKMDDSDNLVEIHADEVFSLRPEFTLTASPGEWDGMSANVKSTIESEENFGSHEVHEEQDTCCGIVGLARMLHPIFTTHTNQTLLAIKDDISPILREYFTELKSLGSNLVFGNSSEVLLTSLSQFCDEYRTILERKDRKSSSSETPQNSRLRIILHEIYSDSIKEMDPFHYVKDVEIISILYCCSGRCTEDFDSTPAFECLARVLAKKLEGPSINCVELVHDELLRVLDVVLRKPVFRKHSELRESIRNVLVALFMNAKESTVKVVRTLVAMESGYINIRHPDFLTGHIARAIVSERYGASNLAQEKTSCSLVPVPPAQSQTFSYTEGKMPIEASVLQRDSSDTARDKMKENVEVMKLLVGSYFKISQRAMMDMVPKAIMLNLVENVMDEMQREVRTMIPHFQDVQNRDILKI